MCCADRPTQANALVQNLRSTVRWLRGGRMGMNACTNVPLARGLVWSLHEDQSVLQNKATSEVISHANRYLFFVLRSADTVHGAVCCSVPRLAKSLIRATTSVSATGMQRAQMEAHDKPTNAARRRGPACNATCAHWPRHAPRT